MKNRKIKFTLTAFALFQSISLVFAQDYSGRHYTNDSSSSSGLGFLIILVLVVAGFIVYGVIQSNSNKPRNDNSYSSSTKYKPQTREQMQKQQADYWQSQLDYMKKKDKEGEAALKGCGWTVVTIVVLAFISYCSNH